jgi:hypothetical protein
MQSPVSSELIEEAKRELNREIDRDKENSITHHKRSLDDDS